MQNLNYFVLAKEGSPFLKEYLEKYTQKMDAIFAWVLPQLHGKISLHKEYHSFLLKPEISALLNDFDKTKNKISLQKFESSIEECNYLNRSVFQNNLLNDLNFIGYHIEPFGNNTFVIQGTPADVLQGNEKHALELLIEQFKHFSSDIKFSKREKLIRCMSRQQAIKEGQTLSQQEMQVLVTELFNCQTPNVSPSGNATYIDFKEDYLLRLFGK